MLGLKKIKNGFIEILKEHPVSIISVMLSMVLYSIICEGGSGNVTCVIRCIVMFLLVFALGALPCEAFRMYKIKNGVTDFLKNKKYLVCCVLIMVVGAILGVLTAIFFTYSHNSIAARLGISEFTVDLMEEYDYRVVTCFAVASVCATLYLFFKKSKCTFEEYTAKAFCGFMKAEIVCAVVITGLFMIVAAFSALIVELDYTVYERVWLLVLGFVQFPCALMGVSKTEEEISKFGKVMLNYVLTGLLAIAFLIIYVYIIKVIVKWMFPLYMVFGILTTLFGFGVFIWTMAQGICEENMRKIFKFMPLLFIPCIIMEIVSLGRQISIYGLTLVRYAGIAAIVFEIAYFVLYIYNMKKEKNAMPLVFCIVVAVTCISLLAPGINAYSAVIASHKGNVMEYLGDNVENISKHTASESYRTIAYSCGAVGKNYIHTKLSDEQNDVMIELAGGEYDESGDAFYVYANRRDNHFDISGGYENLYIVDINYSSEDPMEIDRPEGYEFDVYCDGEMIGKVDLGDTIKKFAELHKAGATYDEINATIEAPIDMSDGGKLILNYIDVHFGEDEGIIDNIDADGYAIK